MKKNKKIIFGSIFCVGMMTVGLLAVPPMMKSQNDIKVEKMLESQNLVIYNYSKDTTNVNDKKNEELTGEITDKNSILKTNDREITEAKQIVEIIDENNEVVDWIDVSNGIPEEIKGGIIGGKIKRYYSPTTYTKEEKEKLKKEAKPVYQYIVDNNINLLDLDEIFIEDYKKFDKAPSDENYSKLKNSLASIEISLINMKLS